MDGNGLQERSVPTATEGLGSADPSYPASIGVNRKRRAGRVGAYSLTGSMLMTVRVLPDFPSASVPVALTVFPTMSDRSFPWTM